MIPLLRLRTNQMTSQELSVFTSSKVEPRSPFLDWENLLQCGVEENVFSRLSLATLCKLKSTSRSLNQRVRQSKRFQELAHRRPCYLVKLYKSWWKPKPMDDIAVHNPLRMEWLPTLEKWVSGATLCPNGKIPSGGETGLLWRSRYRGGFVVVVYNPLTQRGRELPQIPDCKVQFPWVLQMVPRESSYQIVLIGRLFTPQSPFAFYVYDSILNTWTFSMKTPGLGFTDLENEFAVQRVLQVGPVLNRRVFYVLGHVTYPAEECSIWSYNLETDEWRNVDVPRIILHPCINFSIVGCGGKLILVIVKGNLQLPSRSVNDFDEDSDLSSDNDFDGLMDVDVWEMQECQVSKIRSRLDSHEKSGNGLHRESWVHLGTMPKDFLRFLNVSLGMELKERWSCRRIHDPIFELKSTAVLAAEQCIYFCFDQSEGCNSVVVFDCLERSWSWLDEFPNERAESGERETFSKLPNVNLFTFRPDRTAKP